MFTNSKYNKMHEVTVCKALMHVAQHAQATRAHLQALCAKHSNTVCKSTISTCYCDGKRLLRLGKVIQLTQAQSAALLADAGITVTASTVVQASKAHKAKRVAKSA